MRLKILFSVALTTIVLNGCVAKGKDKGFFSVSGILHVCPQNTIALVRDNTEEVSYSLPHTAQFHALAENTFLEKIREDTGLFDVEDIKLLTVKNEVALKGQDELIFSAMSYQQPREQKENSNIVFFTLEKIKELLQNGHIHQRYQQVLIEYLHQIENCVPCLSTCTVGSSFRRYNSPFMCKPIKKFEEIDEKDIQENTLILIDIDNTILRSNTHYGSTEYFSHTIHTIARDRNISLSEAMLLFYDKWIYSQKIIKTTLIDPQIRSFIQKITENKTHVFYFTARQPALYDVTYNQLESHQLNIIPEQNFTFEHEYNNVIFPDCRYYQKNASLQWQDTRDFKHSISSALLYRNIIFGHEFNKKGVVFKDFFKTYRVFLKKNNLPVPTKIILIDDKMYNLLSMDQAAYELGMEFTGYHISDDFVYDHIIGLKEEIYEEAE